MSKEKTYLKWYNKVGYGSGDVAGNVVYALLTSFVMIYLTDTIGLNAGVIGVLIAVSKIFDGVTDIIFGTLIDKTHTKMGKAKPWMLYGFIGCAITLIGVFAIPMNMDNFAQYAWFFICYTLLNSVFYTANNIAYSALTALVTRNSKERVQMGSYRFIFAFGTSLLIQAVTFQFVEAMGGGANGWRTVAIIYAVIGLIVNTISALSVKELSDEELADSETKTEETKYSFGESFKILVHNKYYVMITVTYILQQFYGAMIGVGTYYAKYILGNDNIVALLGAVGLVPTFLGFILTGPLTSKFGMTKTCKISCVLGAAACLVRVFTPYSIATCIAGGVVTTFANIPMMCLFGAMVNNCVEYNDYKFGKRIVGMTNSANSFGMKIGSGIGASLIGWLLAAAGYKASLATQPGSVDMAIFAFSIYIPLAIFVIMFICLMKNDLEKRYPEIMAELQKREKAN